MSKKDKSKFKKQLKAQIFQDMAKFESQNQATSKIQPKQVIMETEKKTAEADKTMPIATTPVIPESEINLPQIRYDLKKTGIIVGSMAITIAILVILDNKYNILSNFGNSLFKILHIN